MNLYSLDLHGCAILNISMGAFHGLETLRVLKLSANSLDTVPSRQLQVRAVNGPSRISVPAARPLTPTRALSLYTNITKQMGGLNDLTKNLYCRCWSGWRS